MFDLKDRLVKFIESGFLPEDDAEIRRKKAALVLVPLIIGPAAFIWGSIYFYLEHPLSGSIPMSYSVISVLSLVYYFNTKRTRFLEWSQLFLVLLLPFMLMWSLGGFFHGSTVMIWALFAPVAASIFMDKKNAFVWFAAYFLLLLLSGAIQNYLAATITPIPEVARQIFFLLNLGAGSAGLYFLVSYTNDQEKLAIERLHRKRTSLEKKSVDGVSGSPRDCSGLMYSGVPVKAPGTVKRGQSIRAATPKSASTGSPNRSIMMFVGFTSRWRMFRS